MKRKKERHDTGAERNPSAKRKENHIFYARGTAVASLEPSFWQLFVVLSRTTKSCKRDSETRDRRSARVKSCGITRCARAQRPPGGREKNVQEKMCRNLWRKLPQQHKVPPFRTATSHALRRSLCCVLRPSSLFLHISSSFRGHRRIRTVLRWIQTWPP